MRFSPLLLSLLAFLTVVGSPAYAQKNTKPAGKQAAPASGSQPQDVVAVVNGQPIPRFLSDAFIAEQMQQGVSNSKELGNAVREELIRRTVVSQAAIAAGLDKDPAVRAQFLLAQQGILIRSLIQKHMKENPVSEEVLKAEYERLKPSLVLNEYKARHILVASEDEAKDLIEQIKKGAVFEELAKKHSMDTGSKDNGGDLGWNAANGFVKPFAESLVTLHKGQRSEVPTKSEFGYHVIQLDDIRTQPAPAFEQIKSQLEQHLQQRRLDKFVSDLRQKAKVE